MLQIWLRWFAEIGVNVALAILATLAPVIATYLTIAVKNLAARWKIELSQKQLDELQSFWLAIIQAVEERAADAKKQAAKPGATMTPMTSQQKRDYAIRLAKAHRPALVKSLNDKQLLASIDQALAASNVGATGEKAIQ